MGVADQQTASLADSGCPGAGRLRQDNGRAWGGGIPFCDPRLTPRGASPWTCPGGSQGSSLVCRESTPAWEPLRKKREEQEEAGGARTEGWLRLERLAPGCQEGSRS